MGLGDRAFRKSCLSHQDRRPLWLEDKPVPTSSGMSRTNFNINSPSPTPASIRPIKPFPQVMVSAITLCHPHIPPMAGPITITDPQHPGRRITAMSYGKYLLHRRYDHVDRPLRHIVAQCLCDQPAHRPEMAAIKTEIAHELRDGRGWTGGDTDAEVVQWVRRILDRRRDRRIRGIGLIGRE